MKKPSKKLKPRSFWKPIAFALGGIILIAVIGAGVKFVFFKSTDVKNSPGFILLAKQKLKNDIMAIEFYKDAHGHYPERLEDIADKENPVFGVNRIYDPSVSVDAGKKPISFYYQLTADKKHYYLFGVGSDGQPFTGDDLAPDLTPEEMVNIGYIKK